MTDALENAYWDKVASTRLGLSRHVKIRQHRQGNYNRFLITDSRSGRSLLLDSSDHLFIQQLSEGNLEVGTVYETLRSTRDTFTPSKMQIMQLVARLEAEGLVVVHTDDIKSPETETATGVLQHLSQYLKSLILRL